MAETNQTAHDFTFMRIDEKTSLPLSEFKDKVIVVVNTASECGFTGQYKGLESLWEKYKDKGLVVLGVPSNDFGGQEPGTATDIQKFCEINYGVTFPLTSKTIVSGKDAHPFYQWAGQQAGLLGRPKWNFHKYLIGRNGEFLDHFASTTAPDNKKLLEAIDKALGS